MSPLKNYLWRRDIFYIDMDTVEEVTDQSLEFDDTISLDFDARFKRKIKLVSDSGYEFFLSLDKKLIKHPSATFFVRVSGNSMVNAKIFDGSILLVDRAEEIKNGDIYIEKFICFFDHFCYHYFSFHLLNSFSIH